MKDNIKPKEAAAIINSLVAGVVPQLGIQHITVGRSNEISEVVRTLDNVKEGHSTVKFWEGDFGAGKSFMLHLMKTVALKQKFVVANADFTPENRLYSNDGKAVTLYTAIIDSLSIQTKPDGGALPTLLEKWIEHIISVTAHEHKLSLIEIKEEKYQKYISENILKTISKLTDAGSFDFGVVIMKYYEGYITLNDKLRKDALRWLKGEYRTKTEARADLGIREIINDNNYYQMLKNFSQFFVNMGYSGFMINLDEAINLYKISTSAMREKNYEKILTIYNDCFQGKTSHMIFNIAGTKDVIENERRGLFSYAALKTRLQPNKFETEEFRDYSQPVIKLLPLDHNEIFVLLKKLKTIFDTHYHTESKISDNDILTFMEDVFNKPGASEFLTPREVIRDFLNILNILRQNPKLDKAKLLKNTNNSSNILPDTSLLDSIEEL